MDLNPNEYKYQVKYKGGNDQWILAKASDVNRAIERNYVDAGLAVKSLHIGEVLQTLFAEYRALPDARRKTCPYCGYQFATYVNDEHLKKCSKVPSTKRLVKMMDNDASLTITGLATKYKMKSKYLRLRFVGTHWTEEALHERGLAVINEARKNRTTGKKKYRKMEGVERCECGILLGPGETICKFCIQDARGDTYFNVYGEDMK